MTEQEIRKYLRRIEEENSQTALRSFYNLCFDRFFRIAYYYLHTEEWAQEVVLDVFLKIWERRESLHHIANLEDYFFITIKNASLNYLEKEQRRKDMTADAFDGVSISGESPEDILVSEELFAHYVKALDRLPERCREIFIRVREEKQSCRGSERLGHKRQYGRCTVTESDRADVGYVVALYKRNRKLRQLE